MVVSHDSFCNPQTLLSPLLPFFLLVIHDTSPYFRRDELFAPFHDLSIYSRLWHNNGLKMFYEVVSKLPNCLTENQMEFSKSQILYCFIVVFLKIKDSQKNSTYMMWFWCRLQSNGMYQRIKRVFSLTLAKCLQ